MKRSLLSMIVLALAFSLVLVPCLYSQATKDTKTGQDRFDGTVMSINKDTSTITLRQTGKNPTWTIVYTKDTTYTYRNQPSTVDEVKEGRRVIVLGSFPQGSTKMTASRIDVREGK
jgi:RecG-like helicase